MTKTTPATQSVKLVDADFKNGAQGFKFRRYSQNLSGDHVSKDSGALSIKIDGVDQTSKKAFGLWFKDVKVTIPGTHQVLFCYRLFSNRKEGPGQYVAAFLGVDRSREKLNLPDAIEGREEDVPQNTKWIYYNEKHNIKPGNFYIAANVANREEIWEFLFDNVLIELQ